MAEQLELTDSLLDVLSRVDDGPDGSEFVCPSCGGSFFRRPGGFYECRSLYGASSEDASNCGWKGPASECKVPSRAALAGEILALRVVLARALPHVAMATSTTSGREFKETTERLLAEMRELLARRA